MKLSLKALFAVVFFSTSLGWCASAPVLGEEYKYSLDFFQKLTNKRPSTIVDCIEIKNFFIKANPAQLETFSNALQAMNLGAASILDDSGLMNKQLLDYFQKAILMRALLSYDNLNPSGIVSKNVDLKKLFDNADTYKSLGDNYRENLYRVLILGKQVEAEQKKIPDFLAQTIYLALVQQNFTEQLLKQKDKKNFLDYVF